MYKNKGFVQSLKNKYPFPQLTTKQNERKKSYWLCL